MGEFPTYLGVLNIIIALCGIFGGFVAFRIGRRNSTISIQEQTIQALQQQVNAIKEQVFILTEENAKFKHVIETIQLALSKRGIHVTIDGELVTISDASSSTSTAIPRRIRKQPPTQQNH